jgi:uncharacterized protein with NAD-binding domain and iron-sulfur cluster
LYQVGWRLGGKGASGRRSPSQRIEEHGLHLWLGFYENAFRLLRECYAENGRRAGIDRFADWRDALKPDFHIGVAESLGAGGWNAWTSFFPPAPGLPGDPIEDHDPFTIQSYMVRSADLLRTLLVTVQQRVARTDLPWRHPSEAQGQRPSSEEVLGGIRRLLDYGRLGSFALVLEASFWMGEALRGAPANLVPQRVALELIDRLRSAGEELLHELLSRDLELRRLWEMVDMVLAICRGVVRHGLMTDPRGFDAIDHYDFREWIVENGATRYALESAFLRGLYDLALAYEDGDERRPRFSAGAGLRGSTRMFLTYRGSMFWKMQAGMGDVVFAPFYEVLSRRGVRFEFFHRLLNVGLSPKANGPTRHVASLDFAVQARPRESRYEPLVAVKGLPSWPAEPKWELLEQSWNRRPDFESFSDQSEVARRALRVGDDFDCVVLAIGLGAVPFVCKELLEDNARWRDLVANVKTVATQAFQVWMREDMEALGWRRPPTSLSGFGQPFDTWADMRQLIDAEEGPADVRAIAYFCSVLPTSPWPPSADALASIASRTFEGECRERVRDNAIAMMRRRIGHLWPRATDERGEFRFADLLVDHDADQRRDHPFESQFWTANVNPSDRYVQSVPGSSRYRISPLETDYDNLTVAGDWTSCGLNEGCVEAAVISGRLAAHAISRHPPLDEIVGYDHP